MIQEYVYYCPMRPPSLGAVPTNGLLYVEALTERKYINDIKGTAWGWAVYKRRLTPAEIADYELIEKPREGENYA